MTFEQIMAANPEITSEVAMAFSKKFEADAVEARNNQTIGLMAEQNARMETFLAEQINRTERMASNNQDKILGIFQAAMQGFSEVAQSNIKKKDEEIRTILLKRRIDSGQFLSTEL